ncbi:MAG: hypothetical protein IJB17_00705 [Oscillospiraceae bacterium]|nr:hypothetical protein [Oscillospiraceae bacterium]
MTPYELPEATLLLGRKFRLNTDFRRVLTVIGYLQDPELPALYRMKTALALFYREEVPKEAEQAALAYLMWFLSGGQEASPGPRLMDWQQDAAAILSDVSRVAGRDVRADEKLHWWSFLTLYQGVGQGQLSLLVTIRDKLRRGQKLEGWEQRFYRENPDAVRLRPRETKQQREQRLAAEKLLEG